VITIPFKKQNQETPSPENYKIPAHLAIIMDGNGRWAKAKGLPRIAGHRKGAEIVRQVVRNCSELGIKNLTLYAFSSENWERPKDEVEGLMGLLRLYISNELADFHKSDARLRIIGDRKKLPDDIIKSIENAELETLNNKKITVNIALSYGGRDEIVHAAKKMSESGALLADINPSNFSQYLYLPDLPEVDLMIRSGGEKRISNFLIWQAAYAELYFLDKLWPEFTYEDLLSAISDYSKRERRYGKI